MKTAWIVFVLICATASGALASSYGDGWLDEVNGFPVLHLKGSEREMGKQYPSGNASADVLYAGLAARDATPRVAAPLAGYGSPERRFPFYALIDILFKHPDAFLFRPAQGTHDPIRAKTMVLMRGDRRLVFISLDVIGASEQMRQDLLRELTPLGIRDEELFLFGTHNHSGPGAISPNLVWELLVLDRFSPRVYDQILVDTVDSVRDAFVGLEPANLSATHFEAVDLQANRRRRPGHFDPRANVMLVESRDSHRALGAVINLPIHPTALGAENLQFSADVPGAMERALETRLLESNGGGRRPTVLFINGAEADVAPSKGGFEGMKELGEKFSWQAVAALVSKRPIEPEWRVRSAEVMMGRPFLNIRNCAPGNLVRVTPKGLALPLGRWFPSSTRIQLIELGDMWMMTWPGEPSTTLGLMLREIAKSQGVEQAWVLSLTNDYLAYFTTPDEYATKDSYEACSSIYGKKGGLRIVQAHRALAGQRTATMQ